MNSARLPDTGSIYKNKLYFYTLLMSNLKIKRNNSMYNSIRKNKMIKTVTKKVQNSYTGNYKTLWKEIKEDRNK